jgi:RND family efflux transporter MFP subunit
MNRSAKPDMNIVHPAQSPLRTGAAVLRRHPALAFLLFALAVGGAAALLAPARSTAQVPAAPAPRLATVPVARAADAGRSAFDGTVQALRSTTLAAQVAGNVVELRVKPGDAVRAGDVLVRLDARAADQGAAASQAQVAAARAQLDAASREFERQKMLFAQQYISQAALDRARTDFEATRAQVNAQLAQAGAAGTQAGFYVLRAPYDAVVAEVPVTLGDMALPGRPLLTLYDPTQLRVSAAVPQSWLAGRPAPEAAVARVVLGAADARKDGVTPIRLQVLPTADATTQTVEVRADLPRGLTGVAPGQFARLLLADAGATRATPDRLLIPQGAVQRHAEMDTVYVLSAAGQPLLRAVRLGASEGGRVEVLAGLSAGEQVVTDPQAAARVRPEAAQ